MDTQRPWFKTPFNTKQMIPIMTGGIIVVLVLQTVIWLCTKGQPIEPATNVLRPTVAVSPTAVPSGKQLSGVAQDTYNNGIMQLTFGPEWTLQTGNAPPNLGFATFTFEQEELGTVNVRIYNTLPSSFILPKREEFYDPKSSYWIVGRAPNSRSATTFQAPVPVTIAGKSAMMQEYETSQQFERAYYIPTDENNTKYLLIITGVNKALRQSDDLFLEVSKLLANATANTDGHSFTDAEGKYSMKLTYARPMAAAGRTFRLPLNGFIMNFERTNTRTAADYLTLKNGCNKPQDGREFVVNGVVGLVFEQSICSPLGESELFLVRNGIAYFFTITDLAEAKRSIFPNFTFTE